MATATLLTDGFVREFGLQVDRGVEYYLVEDALQTELENPASITGLPQPGGTIGGRDPSGLPVQTTTLVRVLNTVAPFKALYVVRAGITPSGTIVPFGRNFRLIRETAQLTVPVVEKTFVQYSDAGGGLHNIDHYNIKKSLIVPRVAFRIVYTSVANVAIGTVDTFNGNNIGKRYSLTGSGSTFIFEGAGATLLENNQLRIEGQWYTTSPMPIQAAGAYPGMDIALPALNNLDEYLLKVNSLGVPSVSVYPISRLPAGATYPF